MECGDLTPMAEPLQNKSLARRIRSCIQEKRFPSKVEFINKFFYRLSLKKDLFFYSGRKAIPCKSNRKSLYVSAVGKTGKFYLEKFLCQIDIDHMDLLIFVYDDTSFDEEIFSRCNFIYEKAIKWQYMKKYLTPDFCKKYDYIFIWDDDIDSLQFSCKRFLDIMERNNLEMAQPALSRDSFFSHYITLHHPTKVGRLTDYVENMVPVFSSDGWEKYWNIMSSDDYFWGWGYTFVARSACKYKNMGIVDSEVVKHTRPVRSTQTKASSECDDYLRKHTFYRQAERISYGQLI